MQKKHKILIAVLVGTFSMLGLVAFLLLKLGAAAENDEIANAAVFGGYLGLGETAMEARQYMLAQPIFEKALEVTLQVNNNETDRAEALTRIGQCLRRRNLPEPALDRFKKATELYRKAEENTGDGLIMFSTDKRMYLKCLKEYSLALKETGKAAEAAKLAPKIDELSKALGPVEAFREKTSEI